MERVLFLLLALGPYRAIQWQKDSEEVRCPSFVDSPGRCECTAASDGLDFNCDGASIEDLKVMVSAARFAIKSLSVTALDANVTCICGERVFGGTNGSGGGVVAELKIASSAIADIDDNAFEAVVKLESIVLRNSKLKTLPRALGKVSSLRRLDLEGNEIKEIIAYTFFSPSKLSHISLKGNRLGQLAENAFLGLENNLRELDLAENLFSNFPMSAVKILKKLQKLNLAGNAIENITAETFTRLESLKFVDLSGNRFSELDRETFLSSPNIQRLSLASNALRTVKAGAFDCLHDLESIDLSRNGLAELPADIFSRTARIARIDLSHNRLKRVADVFVDLYALEEVLLNDNLLLAIGNNWFRNTPNLKVIHLENNVLAEMADDALQPLKRLTQLHLSRNFLTEIRAPHFRYNVALTALSLDNNHLSSMDPAAFRGVPKLKELRLQDNTLKQIDRELFAKLTLLTELHLQNNRIVEIEPQAFSKLDNLQHLDLTGNRVVKLEDIMMRYPSALRTLHLDGNKLSAFHQETFSGQTTAEILSMSGNRLERIPSNVFAELINLFRLNLSHNRLTEVEDNALIGLHQLRYLDLSHNRLTALTPLTLRGLQQAETVDLSNNRIGLIEGEAFTGFHHLKVLDLSHNRLRVLKSGAFRGCLTLDTLLLRDAGIRTIQTNALGGGDLKALGRLDLRGNELAVPDSLSKLSGLATVKILQLSDNDLSNTSKIRNASHLSLSTLAKLEELEMENCNLTGISPSFIAQNSELKVIKLGGNRLSSLPSAFFKKQVFLRELHLDRNHFTSVPADSLTYLFNLATLNLSGNRLADLKESYFDNVGGLRSLDLSRNGMKFISERAFHNVTGLQRLDISHNRLEQFTTRTFVPLVQLETFAARDNLLPFIPVAVQGLRQVKSLQLGGNGCERLKEIPESRAVMFSVEEVALTGTNLTTISPGDFDLFPYLLRLDLSANHLSRVAPYAFRSLGKLESLSLASNDILHLSRERMFGLFSLRALNLSRNHLGSLDAFPPDLAMLAVLDVSHNRLRSVARDSLRQLRSLARLDLRGNLLTQLFPEVLHPLVSLRAIDLGQNLFVALPLEELEAVEDSLESVNFDGNPLVCSCQSYSQKIWLRQHRKWLDVSRGRGSKSGPHCHLPEAIKERHLLGVRDSEICPLPSVGSLAYTTIDPYHFLITWKSPDTNMTGLKGFIVAYHRLDKNDQVKKYKVGPTVRGFRIETVADDTLYLVCVITRGSTMNSDLEEGMKTIATEPTEASFEEEEEDLDGQFYVMPLEWTREKREEGDEEEDDENEDEEEDEEDDKEDSVISNKFVFSSLFPGYSAADEDEEYGRVDNMTNLEFLSFPSSNDTELLVDKPAVVNLGSQSSKCIQIRTPPDPAKLSLVDNKRMSVIIGCALGLIVFVLIILAIVFVKPGQKDGDVLSGEEDLRHTSSAAAAAAAAPKRSSLKKTNSVSSSIATRLLEEEGNSATAVAKIKQSNKEKEVSRRRRQQQHKQRSEDKKSKAEQKQLLAKQSSTESRQSSSDTTTNTGFAAVGNHVKRDGGRPPPPPPGGGGQQSWHGTPRMDYNRRRNGDYRSVGECYSTTLPRKRDGEFSRMGGGPGGHGHGHSGMSLDGAADKRRSDPGYFEASTSSIPLIEYHLVDATNDPPLPGRGIFGRPPPPQQPIYPRWNSGGARPKGMGVLGPAAAAAERTFEASSTVLPPSQQRIGNLTGVSGGQQAVTAADDLQGIDYYQDVRLQQQQRGMGRAAQQQQNAPPRPFVKYNSFAHY